MSELAPLPNWTPPGGFDAADADDDREGSPLRIVTLDAFVSVEEPGAEPLLGGDEGALIPEDGDVMFYGDGGAGKTTLAIDGAFHFAAGDEWLGVSVARKLRVLLVENEGPRPLFRAKLRRKRDGWTGSPIGDRLRVIEAPWAKLTFADPACREALAKAIHDHDVDVVIVGPVTRSGMNEAGTLQEVRDFMTLVDAARELAGRRVTFILIHHENKGGKVSGAWEGSGDTLFHVQGQGHGRTRLYVQKARWSSAYHGRTFNLIWTDGEGFEVEEKDELDDEKLAELILAYIGENPGTGWGNVETATKGVNAQRRRNDRDGLFAAGRIVNIVKERGREVALDHCRERKQARLFLADDPTISQLRLSPDAVRTQIASAEPGNRSAHLRPASRPIRDAGDADADSPAEAVQVAPAWAESPEP